MSNIIDQARTVSRALTEYNRADKAVAEIRSLVNGRSTLTLELLEVTERQLEQAQNRADRLHDDCYTKLTYEVNKGAE